jgi:hypothetical protein
MVGPTRGSQPGHGLSQSFKPAQIEEYEIQIKNVYLGIAQSLEQ